MFSSKTTFSTSFKQYIQTNYSRFKQISAFHIRSLHQKNWSFTLERVCIKIYVVFHNISKVFYLICYFQESDDVDLDTSGESDSNNESNFEQDESNI